MPSSTKQPPSKPKKNPPPPPPKPKKNPKDVPLGTGLADRAKQAIIDRKKMLDEI